MAAMKKAMKKAAAHAAPAAHPAMKKAKAMKAMKKWKMVQWSWSPKRLKTSWVEHFKHCETISGFWEVLQAFWCSPHLSTQKISSINKFCRFSYVWVNWNNSNHLSAFVCVMFIFSNAIIEWILLHKIGIIASSLRFVMQCVFEIAADHVLRIVLNKYEVIFRVGQGKSPTWFHWFASVAGVR